MFLLLNILIMIFVWNRIDSSPNENYTNFQLLIYFILVSLTILTANPKSEIAFLFGVGLFITNLFVMFPAIVMIEMSIRKHSNYKMKNTHLSNSISESPTITLIFPWNKCDFEKVTLNPKFVTKYYDLQDKKRNLLEYLIFTFLKEYFYFKSLKSFYLVKKEQHRKDYLHIK